ncbi:precorrin-6A reductase [Cohaesibacter intestini]|uniref:precorrin-6A reductase n=1 Tax=Cohaesibacter intestini TaxID=2211145 RepID=UPI000DEAA24B|nr:precorrin-6A reductase [Cohaesibacter intestini]
MGRRILILGGTSEARGLVKGLLDEGLHDVTLSLAGALGDGTEASFRDRLKKTDLSRLYIRIGGFGGPDGLSAYLQTEAIDLLIDATHPYAAQISHNAHQAANRCQIGFVRLERPAWEPLAGKSWIEAKDLNDAATCIPQGARVLLAVGRQSAKPFQARTDCHFLLRSIAPANVVDFGGNFSFCQAMPGKTIEEEIQLLQEKEISCLVTKNSGAKRSYHKIAAAHALGLDVVMIKRPILPDCRIFNNLDTILDWLKG